MCVLMLGVVRCMVGRPSLCLYCLSSALVVRNNGGALIIIVCGVYLTLWAAAIIARFVQLTTQEPTKFTVAVSPEVDE